MIDVKDTITIPLPPELRKFVFEDINNGEFGSVAEWGRNLIRKHKRAVNRKKAPS